MAFLSGVLIFVLMLLVCETLFDVLRIASFITYDPPITRQIGGAKYGIEYIVDRELTDAYIAWTALAVILSIRIGRIVFYCSLAGGLTTKENLKFSAALIAISFVTFTFIALAMFEKQLDLPIAIINIVKLVVLGGTAWFFKAWIDRKFVNLT